MTKYDYRDLPNGPVRVIDGHGNEVKKLRRLDTETGEVTQLVTDERGTPILRRGPRGFEVVERQIELPLPVRVEPILSLRRGGEIVS